MWWEPVVVMAIVGWAGWWSARRVWHVLRGRAGCACASATGGCAAHGHEDLHRSNERHAATVTTIGLPGGQRQTDRRHCGARGRVSRQRA